MWYGILNKNGAKNISFTEEEIAFGLKAVMIKFAWPEEKSTQIIEDSLAKIKFCLVYGSFARFVADNESDLDLWLVGEINVETKNRIREIFSTLDREYNMTIETERQFLKKINDPIHQNIIKNHVIIYGEKEFLRILRL